MSRAVTLLTLDSGSVLYNPAQMPDEVVLKHTDGELIKIRRTDTGDWVSERRKEQEVNFWEDGIYGTPTAAVAAIADQQAFGFRLDGEAVNPLMISDSPQSTETIEVEGLNVGGIVVEDDRHLPIAVFTAEEVYYRITMSEKEGRGKVTESVVVVEKKKGPRGGWTKIDWSEPTEAGCLLNIIAKETEMETTSGSTEELREVIDEQQELFTASRTREDEEIREQMAIQDHTAFPPSTPKPRPVDFTK